MLFLIFIKGPDVQEWTSSQVGWLGGHILAGAGRNEEHLYDTVMDSVMIDLLLLVVGHWGYTGEFKRRRITMRRA